MKTSHTRTREWGNKSRKEDNRNLRSADRNAALAEGEADAAEPGCKACGSSESDPDGLCECCGRCSLCAQPECLAFGEGS